LTYLLTLAEKGPPERRWPSGKVPRLAEYHFPTGGHRFRPCVEDVFEMLITQFRVDALPDWQEAVAEGRKEWRDKQLMSAVRDAPETAAKVLRRLGYPVGTPTGGPPSDNLRRLRAF
jgi:hypothetical protein